jgi:hypothetical protein
MQLLPTLNRWRRRRRRRGKGKGGGGRRREDDARCLNNRASSGCGFEGTGGGAHYTRGGGSGDRVVASV